MFGNSFGFGNSFEVACFGQASGGFGQANAVLDRMDRRGRKKFRL
jgi:hypothetical protein